jgi:hypothetical protein
MWSGLGDARLIRTRSQGTSLIKLFGFIQFIRIEVVIQSRKGGEGTQGNGGRENDGSLDNVTRHV